MMAKASLKSLQDAVDGKITPDVPQESTEDERLEIAMPFVPDRVKPENYVSTGVTTLNLGITNHPLCGFEKGTYALLVGASSSGKSMLAMQIMAEAANSPHFNEHRLIYADAEGGAGFDIPVLFGNKLQQRLEYATLHNGEPFQTVEDFYAYVDGLLRKKKPFICILDSMDALSSTSEMERFDSNIQQRQKDLDNDKAYTNLSMGYGDGKAKVNSTSLRRIRNQLPVTGSILIILCQEREAITGMTAGNRVRSGGKALTFYADYEVWFAVKGRLERVIDGHKRVYGQETGVQIKKNRITGIRTDLKFPILQGVGISDTDALLDWLMEEGVIQTPPKSNSKIVINQDMLPPNTPEIPSLSRENLVSYFESNMELLQKIAQHRWCAILDSITVQRKKRYE